jgi:hypothetical protein
MVLARISRSAWDWAHDIFSFLGVERKLCICGEISFTLLLVSPNELAVP